jgi:hypothetical protein
MYKYIILLLIITFFSCQNKEKQQVIKYGSNTCTKKKRFEMYEMSEMASLMEQMYAYNSQLRDRVLNGDTLGKYPQFFNKIFTAKFTTPSDNDAFFIENANNYIATQKSIYSDSNNKKENFNKVVNACIACHQGKCGGPIPRIKKLYLK